MNTNNREEKLKSVRRVLWGVLIANIVITVLKIVLGAVTGALAVVADGFHSLVDSSSNLIGLTAIRLATRPADDRHPYGYQRYETLGALAIGGLLLAAAWEIAQSVIDRLLHGSQAEITWLTFGLIALTFPVNLGIVIYETRLGKRLNSEILLADATHTKTDLFITGSVIASLIGIWLGWGWFDLVVATGVVGLILRASFGILRDAAVSLADVVGTEPDQIEEIARSVPGVRYVRNVRSRGTSDSVFIDLHVYVDPTISTSQGHAIATEVEHRVCSKVTNIVDAIVHIEPAVIGPSSDWDQIAFGLRQIAEGMGLSYHDLHVHVNPEGEFSIELDLEIQGDHTLKGAHLLADDFENRVLELWPKAKQILTHLEPATEKLLYPVVGIDEGMSLKIRNFLNSIVKDESVSGIQFKVIEERLSVVIKLEMASEISLVESHIRVEEIKVELMKEFSEINRVVIHVEPDDGHKNTGLQ